MTLGYLRRERDEVFISKRFLTDNFVSPIKLQSRMGDPTKPGSSKYVHFDDENSGETWINYLTIPNEDLQEYGLPPSKEKLVAILCAAVDKTPGEFDPYLNFIFYLIWEQIGHWGSYVPYYAPYYLDDEKSRRMAKTHAIINEILKLKKNKTYLH